MGMTKDEGLLVTGHMMTRKDWLKEFEENVEFCLATHLTGYHSRYRIWIKIQNNSSFLSYLGIFLKLN